MSQSPRKLSFEQRARSLPNKRAYWSSISLAILFYIIIACIIAAGIGFGINSNAKNSYILIGLAFSAIPVWVIGYLARKKAICPLCKGTLLLDSRASKHQKAFRLFPLNYGTTNIMRAIVTRRMRCHFCGSPYDMLKTNLTSKAEHPPYQAAAEEHRN